MKIIRTINFDIDEDRELKIAKMVIGGVNYTDIARELGISRRQLYNLRQKEGYRNMIVALVDDHMRRLLPLCDSEKSWEKIEALKERGRMIRHFSPKLIEKRSLSLNYSVIEDNRRRSEEIFSRLSPEARAEIQDALLSTNPRIA